MTAAKLNAPVRLAGWLAFALIFILGALGLGVVWKRYQITAAASDLRRLEIQVASLERRSADLGRRVAMALNPEFLQGQNELFQLGLAPVRESQVIRVSESPVRRLAMKRNEELLLPQLGREGSLASGHAPAAFREMP